LEPKTGIFLGDPSAKVRDELWEKALKSLKGRSAAVQIWTDNNPQGFSYRQSGKRERQFVDLDGLALIEVCKKKTDSRINS
jgi:CRISPR-associated protein Cas2